MIAKLQEEQEKRLATFQEEDNLDQAVTLTDQTKPEVVKDVKDTFVVPLDEDLESKSQKKQDEGEQGEPLVLGKRAKAATTVKATVVSMKPDDERTYVRAHRALG